MTGRAPWVSLAVLLPVFVALLAGRALTDGSRLTGHAAGMVETLRGRAPTVIVLGSSLANRGIDEVAMARAMGLPDDAIVTLSLPHAASAHHLAVMQHRVFGAGHQPRWVVVADALRPMLTHELLQEPAGVARLAEQLDGSEAALAARVFGETDPWALRIGGWRARAVAVREAVLDGWRDGVVGAVFVPRGGRRAAAALVDGVNDRLFAGVDPVVPDDAVARGPGWLGATPVTGDAFRLRDHGLLGEMASLASAHGARLALARMPLPPSNAGTDHVEAALEREARAWLDELRVPYLDLRGLPLAESDFEDMRHLAPRGAALTSTALGEALRAVEGGLRPEAPEVAALRAERPPLPSLPAAGCVREAPAGALAGLADGASVAPEVPWPVQVIADGVALPRGVVAPCAGVWTVTPEGALVVAPPTATAVVSLAWAAAVQQAATGEPVAWIGPGGALDVRWSRRDGSPMRVSVRARQVGAGALRVGDRDAPVSDGRVAVEHLAQADGVALAAREGWWIVHHLAVGDAPWNATVLGAAETGQGAAVRVVGGRQDDTRTDARYAAPPPAIPGPDEVLRLPARVGLRVAGFAALSDMPHPGWQRPGRCSPLRAVQDGVEVGPAWQACDAVRTGGGATCHAGRFLWTSPADGRGPDDPSIAWGVALAEDRSCEVMGQGDQMAVRGAFWLYPGDAATFRAPPDRLVRFRDGARSLLLETRSLVGGHPDPIDVRVEAAGVVVLDTVWTPPAGPPGLRTVRLPLDAPVPPSVRDVAVTLRNRSGARFALVVAAVLSEDTVAAAAPVDTAPWPVLSARRLGTPPSVRPPWQRAPDGARAARVPWVRRLGPQGLTGLPSPVVVVDRDGPLAPVDPGVLRAGCARCWSHEGGVVGARGSGPLTVGVDPSFGDGAWWVHPGQQARWRLAPGLDGPVEVVLTVRTIATTGADAEAAVLRVGGVTGALGPVERDGARRVVVRATATAQEPLEVAIEETGGSAHLWLVDLRVTAADGTRRLEGGPGARAPIR